jgi:uncharacterized protein (TIGR02678 family)
VTASAKGTGSATGAASASATAATATSASSAEPGAAATSASGADTGAAPGSDTNAAPGSDTNAAPGSDTNAAPGSDGPPVTLAERLTEQQRQDRRRAVRALLRQPLLTAGGHPEELALVKRHAAWLKEWFSHQAGWPLHVEAELARLHKRPVDAADATRPAWVRPGEPFSRRRYVLLCLTLAALERMDRQTTLGQVAQSVVQLAAEDPALAEAGVEFTLQGRAQRRDLVVAVRHLLELRVLTRVHGSEEQYLSEQGDALYQIHRPVLSRLLETRTPPSLVSAADPEARLEALLEAPGIGGEEARREGLRHRLTRRLLDDPVLYYEDLDEQERDYVQRSRGAIVPQLTEATGLHAELRAEGIALADDRGDLTDVRLPDEGTEGHLTLLVAEHLADRRAAGQQRVALEPIVEHVRQLRRTYGRHWRKAARQDGAAPGLARLALGRLEALGLVRRAGGPDAPLQAVEPRPAIARFQLLAPTAPPATGPDGGGAAPGADQGNGAGTRGGGAGPDSGGTGSDADQGNGAGNRRDA